MSWNLCGIELRTPLVTASGPLGWGEEFFEIFSTRGLGLFIPKTVTYNPKIGNPPPRIEETIGGVINSIGLENEGIYKWLKLEPLYRSLDIPVMASIAGSTLDEISKLGEIINKLDYIVGIELNLSCPNVKGENWSNNPSSIFEVTYTLRKVYNKPIFVKLAPKDTPMLYIKPAIDGGADGLTLFNTFPAYKTISGGLSGPAIRPIYMRLFREVKDKVDVPIMASGGVFSASDVLEYLNLGANAVQIGTAFFKDPDIAERIYEELESFLEVKNRDRK
ncbi:nitronate monooxygenase [bacterium]|nr:nitronate monooxygenase [bacterium]